MSKKRTGSSNKTRIPPDVAAQYFSHLSSSSSTNGGNNVSNNGNRSNNGNPPCSPEEVKALMSMFAEIMGMADSSSNGGGETTTTTTRKSKTTTTTSSSSVSFMFGSNGGKDGNGSSSSPNNWPPSALAAAARAASMYMPQGEGFIDYEDDDEDDDDDYDDEDDDDDDDDDHQPQSSNLLSTSSTDSKGPPVIDPNDWKELEQVANDEVREQQDRERKAAKKREKKQRKKERARQEAALRAAEMAQKKHDKQVTSWKSRVVSAATAGDGSKLKALLKESPLTADDKNNQEHIDFLFPNCVAKTRDGMQKSSACRLKLAEFCLSITAKRNSCSIFMSILKSGRNSIHSASFVGDNYFIQFVLEHVITSVFDDDDDDYCNEDLINWNATCRESGFAPIHYAVLSGSKEVLELLLAQEGCRVDSKTNAALTNREGKEVTALELAEVLLSGKQSIIQSSGSAWNEANEYCYEDRARYHSFLRHAVERLSNVLRYGYTPLPSVAPREKQGEVQQLQQNRVPVGGTPTSSRNRKRKKKKKQQQQQQQQQRQTTPAPLSVQEQQEDPMITALLGMGFTKEQIDSAAKACGGTARATADDLVQWIFAKEAGEETPTMQQPADQQPITQPEDPKPVPADIAAAKAERERLEAFRKAEEARLVQQRLLLKREEQRRRNREWNNREQARQLEEAQARVRARTSYAPVVPKPIVGVNGVHTHQTTMSHHPKNGLIGEVAPPVATTPPKQGMAPIKILTRLKSAPEATIPAVSVPGVQTNLKKHPPGLESVGPDFSHVGTTAGNFSEDATVSSLGSGIIGANEWTVEPDIVLNDSALAGFQGIAASAPPPGFQFGGQNSSPEGSFGSSEQFIPDINATGEIRATARAFIPTTFKPPPGLSSNGGGVRSLSVGSAYELPAIGESNHAPRDRLIDSVTTLLPGTLPHQHNTGFSTLNAAFSRNPGGVSSVIGISSIPREHLATVAPVVGLHSGLGLGNLTRGSESAAPIGSLLDPLVLGPSPKPEPQTIWGSSGSSQSIGSVGAPGIGGLPSLNEGLPSLSRFTNFSVENDKNNAIGSNGVNGSSTGWGSTTASSIW